MLSKLKETIFYHVTLKYYIVVSSIMILLFLFSNDFTDMVNNIFNSSVDQHTLLLIINSIFLLYIPLMYMLPFLIKKLIMNDDNKDSIPDILFIDPYELFTLSKYYGKDIKHKKG